MPAISTDQFAGEQGRQRVGTVCYLLFDYPVLFLNRLPQFPVNDCFMGIWSGGLCREWYGRRRRDGRLFIRKRLNKNGNYSSRSLKLNSFAKNGKRA